MELKAVNLTKKYSGKVVVNEVNIKVSSGEIIGLLGPNGAGKTTFFYMIVGLISSDSGNIFLENNDISKENISHRAKKGLAYLPQESSIFRKLTVKDNILAVLEQRTGIDSNGIKKELNYLIEKFRLNEIKDTTAQKLSGGERRRTEIARALALKPQFLLLDEPFAGIDPIAVNDIQEIVRSLRHRKIGVIISDHNVEQTLEIVDRAYIMYEGKIRVSGNVSELVWNDEVAEIYLGPTLTTRMRGRYPQPEEGSLRAKS